MKSNHTQIKKRLNSHIGATVKIICFQQQFYIFSQKCCMIL